MEDDNTIRLKAVEALKHNVDVLDAQNGDRAMALIMDPDNVDVYWRSHAMEMGWGKSR